MIFSYVVLNKNNKKVEGEISAEDVSSARKRLHAMGFSVLSISEKKGEIVEKPQEISKKDFFSFEFKAKDKKGKEIVGTIDAKEDFLAYKRLVAEFQFEVLYIFNLAVDAAAQEEQKHNLKNQLEKKYKLLVASSKEGKQTEQIEVLEKANIEKLNVLRNQVDVMIAEIKQILNKAEDISEKKQAVLRVRKMIGELERIKMSNNITHIRVLADKILEVCEEIFKEKEEFKIIIKQKDDLKESEVEKWQQMHYHNLMEVGNISTVLQKVQSLLKKYVRKIGIKIGDEDTEKKSELILEKIVEENELKKNPLFIKKSDLISCSKIELKQQFFSNLKKIFSFKQKDKRIIWQNIRLLFKTYFFKDKKVTDKETKDKTSWRDLFDFKYFTPWIKGLFQTRLYNPAKNDYEPVFREINVFFGWLLCFYLTYFLIGGLILQKNFIVLQDFFYKTLTSEILLFFVFFVFLFHLLIKLKIRFFRQNFLGSFSLFMIGIFILLLFVVNY